MTWTQTGRASDRWSTTFAPSWWLTFAWLAMGVGTVWSVHRTQWGLDLTGTRVLAACLFVVAALAVHAVGERFSYGPPATGVLIATLAGLLTILVAPSGLGEVPVYVVASRIPYAFPGRSARWVVVIDTVATSAVIGYVSHSIAGCLAGIGIPFLAQRALDRRALIEQRDRAQALLAEVQAGREAETQAAALRERGRIAREMHDVLAHSLAGLSLQLQAARLVAQKEGAGPAVLEPLDRAAALARDGLAEARSAVGTLNDPTLRGVSEIPGLVHGHAGASLTVSGAERPLSPSAAHAIYRAIQESLTNAARYAPGSSVRVTLAWETTALNVVVEDDGPAAGHRPLTGQGSGMGLSGMQERLAAVGGSAQAGSFGAGWRVQLAVPFVQAAVRA